MATHAILLPIPGDLPSSDAPAIVHMESSGTPPLIQNEAHFDFGTEESMSYTFILPANYVGTPVLRYAWKTNVGSGNVRWAARVGAITTGEVSNTKGLDTENAANQAANATVRATNINTLSLTNADSMAAGEKITIRFYRDATDAGDTVDANDAELESITFEYDDA